MIIKPIASGSAGNCYYISDGSTELLIDCGISINRIQEALWEMGTRLSNIKGCLVSHSHGDHVKAAQKLADAGVDIYTSAETIRISHLGGCRVHPISDFINKNGEAVNIGSFIVYALEVKHDAPETLSFVVSPKKDRERLLYVTDAEMFQYKIDHLTHIMIEANYDPDVLTGNVERGSIHEARAKRTIRNHMSIETALLTLSRLDKSLLRQVWLLHLSNDNAGADFKRRAQEITGVEVYTA